MRDYVEKNQAIDKIIAKERDLNIQKNSSFLEA